MKIKDLAIIDRHYNPHVDGYLTLARVRSARALPAFVVGWQARHAPNELHDTQKFIDDATARESFDRAMVADEIPDAAIFAEDHQQDAVYRWEDDIVAPAAWPVRSAQQVRDMTARIAQDYGLSAPRIKWMPHTNHSEYDDDDHTIEFGHRDSMAVVHEMAHAVYAAQRESETGANHSPGFVWTAIEMYHRYLAVDLQMMMASAVQRGLLGDMAATQFVAPATRRGGPTNDNAPRRPQAQARPPGPHP